MKMSKKEKMLKTWKNKREEIIHNFIQNIIEQKKLEYLYIKYSANVRDNFYRVLRVLFL